MQSLSFTEIEGLVTKQFARFGINKKREILRLLFEISKAEKLDPGLIDSLAGAGFDKVKDELLKLRYPGTYGKVPIKSYFLPKFFPDPKLKLKINEKLPDIDHIYVDPFSRDSEILSGFRQAYPEARVTEIETLKAHLSEKPHTGIKEYNQRSKNIYIINEKYDFFKQCPCTDGAVNCGYGIINVGFGCPYECTYCYLQSYQNFPGIILPSNINDFFDNPPTVTSAGIFGTKRIGSGEFTDSLVYDDITGFSLKILEFFRDKPDFTFEFKTKSDKIDNLLAFGSIPNAVVSWSLNPQAVIDENEFYSAGLSERLAAAVECAKAGFGVGFHFDPVIHYEGWETGYKELVEKLLEAVPSDKIRWISLGTLRMAPDTKKVIENRFPGSKLLNGELLLDFDGKLRYHQALRIDIYKKMLSWIRKKTQKPPIYLCMESKSVWHLSDLF
jgi:spore photoproduct lyase